MYKNIILGLSSVVILSGTYLLAEAPATPSKVEKSKSYDEAYKLLKVMNLEKSYAETLDQMMQAQSRMLPAELQNDKAKMEQYTKVVNDFINKYVGWDKMKDDMAKMYTKHYTASELQDLSKFYATETGKKTIKVMPQIAAESMQISQGKIMPHMQELQESIAKVMGSK